MIYTCTCNPSLDYYLNFDEINYGKTNRSNFESFSAGGKGINVSIALDHLDIKSSALGFLGGFTKDFYLSFLLKYQNIQPLFTSIKDHTRIDVKLLDKKETSLNAVGPKISKEEFERFKNRLLKLYNDDILVVSGNIEEDIEDDMISLIKELASQGIKIVLDTNARIINECLDVPISLIRITDDYLNGEDALNKTKELHDKSKATIIYYQNNKECLFAGEKLYKSSELMNIDGSLTGIGDSIVAGFLYSLIKGANYLECIKYALAAGKVNALNEIEYFREEVEKNFEVMEVKEVE